MVILRNIRQGTPEWHELRRTRMTASHACEIANAGKGLDTLCRRIAAQIYTGEPAPEGTKTEAMVIGSEEETFARSAYELMNGCNVEQVGFVIYNDFVGASPDGLVGEDGGCEFKRKTFEKHNNLLLGAEAFESGYVWQCHMNMLVLDREWWDLSSYNPMFKERCLHTVRIGRDRTKDEALLAGFAKGEDLIRKYVEMLGNGGGAYVRGQ